MRKILATVCVLGIAGTASAQSNSGIFGGFTSVSPDFTNTRVDAGDHLNGWIAGVDWVQGAHFGVMARVDGTYGGSFDQGLVIRPLGEAFRPSIVMFAGGPRFSVIAQPRVAIFLDALFGVARVGAGVQGVDARIGDTSTGFVGGGGGGVEIALRRTLDVAGEVQYRRASVLDTSLNIVQVSVALVVRPWRR